MGGRAVIHVRTIVLYAGRTFHDVSSEVSSEMKDELVRARTRGRPQVVSHFVSHRHATRLG